MKRSEFEAKALEHLDAVHRMAMHLARRPYDAADIVQETYLRALRASPGYEEKGGGIRPWLMTIAHNVFHSRLKKNAREPLSVDEFYDQATSERAPDEPPPAWDLATLNWEYVDDRLKHAIEQLKDEHRIVLLLWGVEGLKYREIAEILGAPIGTVMSRLHRARKIVADALGDLPDSLGIKAPVGSDDEEELIGTDDDV